MSNGLGRASEQLSGLVGLGRRGMVQLVGNKGAHSLETINYKGTNDEATNSSVSRDAVFVLNELRTGGNRSGR